MKRITCAIAVAGLVLGVAAQPALAQLHGSPVYAWMGGPGITIAGDFGRGLNDESGRTQSYGGRIGVSLPMLSVWAGAAAYDLRVDGLGNSATFGGGVALNVLNLPAVPVKIALHAGAGVLSQNVDFFGTPLESSILNLPIGAALAVKLPTPGISVEPWISPRIHIMRASVNDLSSTNAGFGTSGGLNVTLPMGIGAHAGFDWMSIGDPAVTPVVFGAGVHYRIALPGLGIM